ncbi:glr3321 [Gloeobacter violaceus PCC 7421]|uniref:Glr3321 protein n=1 Tax=Gloeobacter violaceus (strain ATCC 29082 / PCC 7421) TaxID=251221 RepID=Q7NG52_GLOVI|nr:glr3321 [Gloeobacter violaceus PCC 7421]
MSLATSENVPWNNFSSGSPTSISYRSAVQCQATAPKIAIKPFLPALAIALRTGRSVYDSLHLALAVHCGCRMVSTDLQLCNALGPGAFAPYVLGLLTFCRAECPALP